VTTDTARWVDYEQLVHHRLMLSDSLRTEAFRAAIHEAVRDGDVVVDLGTGSGILALFASRTGARDVYAIERTKMADAARQVLEAGADGKAQVIASDSDDVDLPEQCDVLVSECLGFFGLQENMLSDVLAFRDRWLKPGGRVIPSDVRLFAAPVDDPTAFEYVGCWDRIGARYEADFSSIKAIASNSSHRHVFGEDAFLAPAEPVSTIDMLNDSEIRLDSEVSWTAQRSGDWHGVCGFFTSTLSEQTVLDTAPGASTHWQQEFFPRHDPVEVKEGDVLGFAIRATLHKARVDWHWEMSINDQPAERHSMDFGVQAQD
jgi:SAM-dependent methyltransferase